MRYFNIHLKEAIALNLSRRAYYTKIAGQRARLLSHLLVASERLCLSIANYFDTRAQPFITKGIPVVKKDFVSMDLVESVDAPPKFKQCANPRSFSLLSEDLKLCQKKAKKGLLEKDFIAVAECIHLTLLGIEELEKSEASHFAMVKHVLESAGLAAFNAFAYSKRDHKVEKLCCSLVSIQVNLVGNSLFFDKLAQKCHERGAGIIVNDVPAIPFVEKLEKGHA